MKFWTNMTLTRDDLVAVVATVLSLLIQYWRFA